MGKTFKFFLLIFLFTHTFSSAQEFSLKGKIIDENNSSNQLYEIVLLNPTDSLEVKSDFVNQDNQFNIIADRGKYLFQIKVFSNIVYNKDLQIDKDLDLGSIVISPKIIGLNEIVIEGKKKLFERKVDRLIFNIENSISARGGDAVDALKITPSIKVQNEKISMIGKKNLAIMVDDKLISLSGDELINFLKSIKSEEIKSIEVINNPPAKYDAEGNSGIVNIKLKNGKKNDWSILANGSYTQGSYPTGSIGSGFTYQKNKLSIVSSISYTNGSKKSTENEFIEYPTQLWENRFVKKSTSDILTTRVGLDYKLSKNWTIGGQYIGSFSQPESTGINKNKIFDRSNVLDSIFVTNSHDYKKMNTNSINLHSMVKLDSLGKNFTFDIDYLNFYNNNNRQFSTKNFDNNLLYSKTGYQANSFGIQNLNIYSAKIDFDTPLKWVSLKYGAKIASLNTTYNNKYYDLDDYNNPTLNDKISNEFHYKENTQAAYISGEKEFLEKWTLQLGLRLENTSTKGNSITLNQIDKNNYLRFFPSAFITYKWNNNNSYSFIYNKRLSRPRYNELNPFKTYYNPYSYTEGNPYLKPEFVNNFEIQHAYKNFIFSSFSYSHTKDGKGNPPFFNNETKVLKLYDMNFYSSDVFNLSSTLTYDKIKWLESSNTINLSYSNVNFYPELNFTNTTNFNLYFSTNTRFILNQSKTLKAEINFWYQSPQVNDLYKNKESSNLGIGLSYILKNSITMNLVVNDILKTNYDRAKAVTNNPYRYNFYDDQRFIKLYVSYKFGKKNSNLRSRSNGIEEEKGRIDN